MKKYFTLFITVIISLITSTHSDAIKIVDGWTWKYETDGTDWKFQFEYKFDGTEVINGKEYHLFKNTAAKKLFRNYKEGGWYYGSDIGLSAPWYVRQEDGKFYVYPNWEKRDYHELDMLYYASDTDDSEILLYDFSLPTGGKYKCCQGSKYMITATIGKPVNVMDQGSPLECKEIEYTLSYIGEGDFPDYIYHYRPLLVSEDLGILENGFLTFFTMGCYSGEGDYEIDSGPILYHCQLFLLTVEDEQGNVIYDANPLASSPELEMDTNQSNQLIDLHGREVSNPLPGSIYIHNGRKFVGK
ncbi:MAG: hypothetical protein K2M39_02020 [Muribaculaceae bacterium]|nr:hypothetical protein [Muribaculaceae bacterium]